MVQTSLVRSDVALLREILDVADTTRKPATMTAFFDVLDLVTDLVHGDAARVNGVDAVREEQFCAAWSEDGLHQTASAEGLAAGNTDPVTRFFWRHYWRRRWSRTDRTGCPDVGTFGSWYTRREWAKDPVLNQIWPDVVDQALVAYPVGPGRSVRLLVAKSDQPFGERDLVLLRLLQAHLRPLLTTVITHPAEVPSPLTVRQLEILDLVRLGLPNGHIARALNISEATVRKHLEHSYERLGVRSRTAAVAAVLDSR